MGMNRTFKAAVAALIFAVGFAGSAAADLAADVLIDREALAAYAKGDYATALRLWRPLADRGDPGAQSMLGDMYDEGWGAPQDYVLAHMWFNLAAASGDQYSAKARDKVAKQMTPAQIAEAQKLAREWKPK
jgi:TPR repeat protein